MNYIDKFHKSLNVFEFENIMFWRTVYLYKAFSHKKNPVNIDWCLTFTGQFIFTTVYLLGQSTCPLGSKSQELSPWSSMNLFFSYYLLYFFKSFQITSLAFICWLAFPIILTAKYCGPPGQV